MCLAHTDLGNYYQTNFNLVQHHKYSITEVENMYPFERDIFLEMLVDWIKAQEEIRNGRN
ncbi:MAG: hypothetical protein O3C19_07425 [Bacteroidetes bacterium]|nr:hypothetical protein [Bacteroidota bacterium]